MNKLNNKFLLILLCVSNSGFGASFQQNACVPQNLRACSVNSATRSGLSSHSVTNIPRCRHKKKPTPITWEDEYILDVLVKTIARDNVESVKRILVTNPGLLRTPRGSKLLHTAICNRSDKYIDLFLAHHANPNVLSDYGNSPLHLMGNGKAAQLFIDYGAYVEQKNSKGRTPIFSAIENSCFDVARVLLKAGADIDEADGKSNTPLHYAVKNLITEEIKFLLYHGANADKPNKQGITPYQMALQQGGAVLQVFEDCRKVLFLPDNTQCNERCFYGKPSIITSLLAHNGKALKKLLMLNASGYCSRDIVIAENVLKQCDNTVLAELESKVSPYDADLLFFVKLVKERSHHREQFVQALQDNSFFVAKQLLQINPYLLNTYEEECDRDAITTLFADKFLSVSASSPDYRHIKELLHESFDLNLCNNDQRVTLLCQLIMDVKDKTKYADLLKSGVSVNTVDIYGKTPLSYAVLLGDVYKVRKLLEYGAVVQSDMLTKEYPTSFSVWRLLNKAFKEQNCCVCEKHPADMSNIPCINRHSGNFICKSCYVWAMECPLCKRALEPYAVIDSANDYVRTVLQNKHVEEKSCVICFEYFSGIPVIPCVNSHPSDRICEGCYKQLDKCPLCFDKLGEYPNSEEKGVSL